MKTRSQASTCRPNRARRRQRREVLIAAMFGLAIGAGVFVNYLARDLNYDGAFLLIIGYFGCLAIWIATSLIVTVTRRHRSQHWPVLGLSSECGYDLRATPDRCP